MVESKLPEKKKCVLQGLRVNNFDTDERMFVKTYQDCNFLIFFFFFTLQREITATKPQITDPYTIVSSILTYSFDRFIPGMVWHPQTNSTRPEANDK